MAPRLGGAPKLQGMSNDATADFFWMLERGLFGGTDGRALDHLADRCVMSASVPLQRVLVIQRCCAQGELGLASRGSRGAQMRLRKLAAHQGPCAIDGTVGK